MEVTAAITFFLTAVTTPLLLLHIQSQPLVCRILVALAVNFFELVSNLNHKSHQEQDARSVRKFKAYSSDRIVICVSYRANPYLLRNHSSPSMFARPLRALRICLLMRHQ